MAEPSILLTCAGMRVDIVRAFVEALAAEGGGRVLVSDLDPLAPARFSADGEVVLPAVDDPDYGARVAEACAREGVVGVLPLTDLDPVLLAEARPLLEDAGARVFVPEPAVALGCQDKWECHLLLGATGLPSPPTWLPEQADPDALPYPVLLKPRLGFAARHIYAAADRAELEFFHAYSPAESVIQQRLGGEEFSIDCLGDLDGAPIGAIPRAMLQAKGGEQIKGETLDDAQLVELGAAVVAGLGLVGPSTVQCFRDGDRVLGVTDINTRFGGGFPLPLAAGGDYPRSIVRMALGRTVESRLGTHRAGVVMTRHLDQTILVRGPGGVEPLRAVQ